MAQAHRLLAGRQQPLQQVVHRQVARGTGQHLLAAAHRLADHLDDRGRLARARRPVQDRQVVGRQGEAHRLVLRGVEAGIERQCSGNSGSKAGARSPSSTSRSFGEPVAVGGPPPLQGGGCRCRAASSPARSRR